MRNLHNNRPDLTGLHLYNYRHRSTFAEFFSFAPAGYYHHPSSPGYYRNHHPSPIIPKNLMDADYNNCIKATAPIIHWQHYKEWAFESRRSNLDWRTMLPVDDRSP